MEIVLVLTAVVFFVALFGTESFIVAGICAVIFFAIVADDDEDAVAQDTIAEKIEDFTSKVSQLKNAEIINRHVDSINPSESPQVVKPTFASLPSTSAISVSDIPGVKKRYISSGRRSTATAKLNRSINDQYEACVDGKGCFQPYIVQYNDGTYFACENIRSGTCYIIQ